MKAKDFKRTKLSVELPPKHSIGDWIASKYYERFGTDEFIQMVNKRDKEACTLWWNKNIRRADTTLTVEEFKEWFLALAKKRPKDFDKEQFARVMIQTAYILQPAVAEQKPLYTEESMSEMLIIPQPINIGK